MVVDTSALVAVMLQEPDCDEFLKKLARATTRQISAVCYLEAAMVLIRHYGDLAEQSLDTMLEKARIVVTPISLAHAKLAVSAFRQYGKGRHPAGLNFGDCFSYALAKATGEPLLFKGADFAKTDVEVA